PALARSSPRIPPASPKPTTATRFRFRIDTSSVHQEPAAALENPPALLGALEAICELTDQLARGCIAPFPRVVRFGGVRQKEQHRATAESAQAAGNQPRNRLTSMPLPTGSKTESYRRLARTRAR